MKKCMSIHQNLEYTEMNEYRLQNTILKTIHNIYTEKNVWYMNNNYFVVDT